jgi:NAD-dependent DNA ligase
MLPPTAEELKGKSMDYKAVMAAISAGNEQAARKLLQQCNDAYYGNGTSSLTDAEFDAAQKAYTAKFGLPLKTAPTVKPAAKGRTDRHAGVAHDWPFLSGWLAKAAGKEELLDWYAKRRASANVSATQVGSPKWDGMSVVLTYDRHGNVQRALTRGDDGRGVDVTRLFAGECHFRDYDAEVRFGVKYEIVIPLDRVGRLR